MKERFLPLLIYCSLFFLTAGVYAQVGIGTTTPNTSASLELAANNKGILVNRVALTATNNTAPVNAPANGLLVFNTATSGTGSGFDVEPGFYYYSTASSSWIPLGSSLDRKIGSDDQVLTSDRNLDFNGHVLNFTNNSITQLNNGQLRLRNDPNHVLRWAGTGLPFAGVAKDGPALYGYKGGLLGSKTGSSDIESIALEWTETGKIRFNQYGGTNFTTGTPTKLLAVNSNGEMIATPLSVSSSSSSQDWYEVGTTFAPDNIEDNIYTNGKVMINMESAPEINRFTVTGEINEDVVNAISSGTGNALFGYSTGSGAALYAENTSTGSAITATGVGPAPSIVVDNTGNYDAIKATTTSGTAYNALWATNSHDTGTAILTSNGNITSVYSTGGAGIATSGPNLGIYSYAGEGAVSSANEGNAAGSFVLDADSDVATNNSRAFAELAGFDNVGPTTEDGTVLTASNSYYGGYFSGGATVYKNNGTIDVYPSYAYAGIKHNTADGTGGTNYKIIGNGTNSTLIQDAEGTPRIMFSPEAPEILFQDYGVGKLVNGEARIEIDEVLKHSLYIDEQHPLKVFVTLEGDCNGVYVTDKSIDGFTVKELNGGTSNVPFSWQIVANRADDKDGSGNITSKHVGLRLPVGPAPLKQRKAKAKEIKKTEPRTP